MRNRVKMSETQGSARRARRAWRYDTPAAAQRALCRKCGARVVICCAGASSSVSRMPRFRCPRIYARHADADARCRHAKALLQRRDARARYRAAHAFCLRCARWRWRAKSAQRRSHERDVAKCRPACSAFARAICRRCHAQYVMQRDAGADVSAKWFTMRYATLLMLAASLRAIRPPCYGSPLQRACGAIAHGAPLRTMRVAALRSCCRCCRSFRVLRC